MSFTGINRGALIFLRVLQPERLFPQRGRRMTLEPPMIASITVAGAHRVVSVTAGFVALESATCVVCSPR